MGTERERATQLWKWFYDRPYGGKFMNKKPQSGDRRLVATVPFRKDGSPVWSWHPTSSVKWQSWNKSMEGGYLVNAQNGYVLQGKTSAEGSVAIAKKRDGSDAQHPW